MGVELLHGDCLEKIKSLEDNTVDFILTDPPYELGFMGKKWDSTGIVFNIALWKEALRVLKPGGYLMSFSGTRTYHRMACAIEEAGFEIKDMIEWLYGSGFPKGQNISKALDKKLGKERKIIGKKQGKTDFSKAKKGDKSFYETAWQNKEYISLDITAPTSDLAKQYDGYNTQLKPSHEPICLAMKPLSEKTFVDNVIEWGTGALNIDGSRVGDVGGTKKADISKAVKSNGVYGNGLNGNCGVEQLNEGRYPANIIVSENISPILDNKKDGASRYFKNIEEGKDYIPFIYHPKASRKDRNIDINGKTLNCNNHTTVKPTGLMKYLLKMGLPPIDNAVILDMFAGSGTTGVSVEQFNKENNTNHKCILIEKEKEYISIIEKRLNIKE